MFSYNALLDAVTNRAAIRRRRRLQPAGGVGDKLFPPTYPGEGKNDPPRHVFERRRIDGGDVACVLIDSVQSQANRLEEALLDAARDGSIRLPRVVVDFSDADLKYKLQQISSLEAPHRIFDAILRDTNMDGQKFRDSDVGQRLIKANPHNATAVLEISPTALLFGAWNSTGEGGGLGAKFTRAIVSEIVGIGVPVEEMADSRTGEISLRSAGRRTGSRIDPLGLSLSEKMPIYHSASDPSDWTPFEKDALKDKGKPKAFDRKGGSGKPGSLAKINHGNIRPKVDMLGITCDYAEQTAVITLAGLRRLRFKDEDGRYEDARDKAARAYLAALGLVALLEQDARGYALRSRCDLVCDGPSPLELVGFADAAEIIELDVAAARALHEETFNKACEVGFKLNPGPLRLVPQEKLVHIVRESQNKALKDEGGESEGE